MPKTIIRPVKAIALKVMPNKEKKANEAIKQSGMPKAVQKATRLLRKIKRKITKNTKPIDPLLIKRESLVRVVFEWSFT